MTIDKVINVAAYLHAWFEFIHPFADGNGRTGRMLMNYYLLMKGHPPIIIYEEDKKLYYKSLEHFSDTQDVSVLIDFLKDQCTKTWNRKKLKRISIFDTTLL
ncbi:MAG: Fic family protein [Anaeroplasmataceae bacterium]